MFSKKPVVTSTAYITVKDANGFTYYIPTSK